MASRPAAKELSDFAKYNLIENDTFKSDELERYFYEERTPTYTNLLEWLRANEHRYPILRHMAFDHLAAPANGTADEREFSMAGSVLDEEHWHTLDELAQAQQCLKSSYYEDIEIRLSTCAFLPGDAGEV